VLHFGLDGAISGAPAPHAASQRNYKWQLAAVPDIPVPLICPLPCIGVRGYTGQPGMCAHIWVFTDSPPGMDLAAWSVLLSTTQRGKPARVTWTAALGAGPPLLNTRVLAGNAALRRSSVDAEVYTHT
jgi:hypothetical protein